MKKSCFFFISLFYLIEGFTSTKIYDCFLYFNEQETLEIRLHELFDAVDYFVLVECPETFRGTKKPLYYEENKAHFAKFADKIIHIPVRGSFIGSNAWQREYYQRNQIKMGLKRCKDSDIVIISDLDEVIRGTDVQRLISKVKRGEENAVSGQHANYGCYLNRRNKVEPIWSGAVATTYRYFKTKNAQFFRDRRHRYVQIPDIGWHFSYLGGLQRYIKKIESFAHAELDTAEQKDPQRIYQKIVRDYERVPIDSSFPWFVVAHAPTLLKLGFLDFEGNNRYQ